MAGADHRGRGLWELGKAEKRLARILAFVFFFSGFSSLIYQVVWQRLLTLHYGVGAVSIAVIVSVYMFGLGIGALVGGIIAERTKKRLRLYFLVELLLGVFGLLSLPLLGLIGRLTAGSGYPVSFLYMFAFLSMPTFLMGVTLPLLTKIFNRLIKDFLSTVGFLYFINTLGAATGSVFAGYVAVSLFGLDRALYIAVLINFLLAAIILKAARRTPGEETKPAVSPPPPEPPGLLGGFAYAAVFVTGFLAIGYEILWFRVVGVLVKVSPYAFSTVLSVYLLGIAAGSRMMSGHLGKGASPEKRSLFFLLQFLIGVSVAAVFIGYYYFTKHTFMGLYTHASFQTVLHPPGEVPPMHGWKEQLLFYWTALDIFIWPMIFVFLPTVLMGASFPLISYLAQRRQGEEGRTVGTVFFFNIAGNVSGGLLTGLLLLPRLGTERTLMWFSAINALFVFFVTVFRGRRLSFPLRASAASASVLFMFFLFPGSGKLYEAMHTPPLTASEHFIEEGMDSVVVTFRKGGFYKNFINGLGHGVRPGYAYYYQVAEVSGLADNTKDVLIIGYGAGSITEAALKLEGLNRATLVEISPTLIKNLRKMEIFRGLFSDPRLEIVIEDGRRHLLRTDEKYDIILMDPIRTSTAYSNNIYSREFFSLAASRLKEGGVILVSMDNEKRVMPKTVLSAFKHVLMYGEFCIASNSPLMNDSERKSRFLRGFKPDEIKGISEVPWRLLGDEKYVLRLTSGYPVNRDMRPVCEYYLGLKIREMLLAGKDGPG